MNKIYLYLLLSLILLISSCGKNEKRSDAYGNFEAVETIVSAEATGKLIDFNIEEGQLLEKDVMVGNIDADQLSLKKQQIEAQKHTIKTKFKNVFSQISVYQEQKKVNQIEKNRIERLLKDDAATTKQLDDINGSINVLNKQIASIESQNSTTMQELKNLDVQVQQVQDQIEKSAVINPVKGTVLMKLAEQSEIVNYGKPLYKIADISTMELRVYVSGEQLPGIKLGQMVRVLIDSGKGGYRELEGTISWISSKSEFTPKIIQTKEERVNLVYAIKVRVANDGSLKIGMPGEVIFK
ncbi:MAG: HlyD family efflux transporter periplasmic adaptor subunit [Ignavibacteriae bacterium]|nr:HlyD family efflux transporter periplasmic adaptor subunit [Ignavibacteriota bacterium]